MNNNIDHSMNYNNYSTKFKCSSKKNNGQFYVVEKIINKKIKNGNTFYMVKWENYKDEECTWEPMQNLLTARDLIDDYENENKFLNFSANPEDNQYGNVVQDVPNNIIGVKMNGTHMSFIISWKPRKDGFFPLDSAVSYFELKKNFPYTLLDFFETKLIYNNYPVAKINKYTY